jgi:hypothetical protein
MTGWVRFSDRFSVNDRVYYSIRDGNNWEVGFGTVGSSNTLARTTIIATLASGAFTSGGTGLTLSGSAIVRAVMPETLFSSLWKVEFATVAINSTLADGFVYAVTASSLTLTLPAAPGVGDRIGVFQGAAGITGIVIAPGSEKINGVSGNMSVDTTEFAFNLVYVSAGYGWKVLS